MNTPISCPDATRWQALLEGVIPEEEQADLNNHLETCAACQQTLERLAAGEHSWVGAAHHLRREQPPRDQALGQAINELKGNGTAGETLSAAGDRGGPALDFLAPPAKPGQLGRLGHYEVIEVIGQGGNGIVLRALDPTLNRFVAIKVLAPQLATSAAARKRFEREAKAAAAVRNEHVIGIHEVDEVNGLPYLVMEYISGVSLQDRIDRRGPLKLEEILRIGMQAATGLAAAHAQGLIHRDIKPANILLENGVERVKITDFGLARAVDDASLTQSGVVAGTPQYMAPEQARGEALDHRADLFSLGSVLYFMCTGRPPFRATETMAVLKRVCDDTPRPIREINPEIPEWLCAIIGKLQAKNVADRFQTAAQVAEQLGQHLAHVQRPAQAPNPALLASLPSDPHPPARKRVAAQVWLPILAGVAVVVIVSVIAWSPPNFLRTLTNHGMLEVEVDDDISPVKVLVLRDGRQVTVIDTQFTNEAQLAPGLYQLELIGGSRRFEPGELPRAVVLSSKQVTVARGEQARVRVKLGDPMVLQPGPGEPPFTLDPATAQTPTPPKPVKLKAFDPATDKLLDAELPVEQGVVRIVKDKIIGANDDAYPLMVDLFEFPDVPAVGDLLYRIKIKTESRDDRIGFKRLRTYLHLNGIYSGDFVFSGVSPGKVSAGGSTDWQEYEFRCPINVLENTKKGRVAVCGLFIHGTGVVWVKDVELYHVPPPPRYPPRVKADEVLIKSFSAADRPIAKDYLYSGADGWRIWTHQKETTFQLFEVANPKVEACRLVFRGKMKTSKLSGAYLEMQCRLGDGIVVTSEKPAVLAKGNTDWASYDVVLPVPPGERPDLIRLNLKLLGDGFDGGNYTWANDWHDSLCWIKDVDLLKAPLAASGGGKEPSPASTDVAPKPVTLKTFKPGADKPLTATIKQEEDAWRFDKQELGSTELHFFTVRDPVPVTGVIIFRAKIKSQAAPMATVLDKVQGRLFLGSTYSSVYGLDSPTTAPSFDGEKSEWTPLEARYPAYLFHQTDPPVIPVDLWLWNAGTIWIKDIELVYVPPDQTPKPEPPLRKKDEVVVKSFTYKDKPITTDFVNETLDGWRFWAYNPRSFRLFELIDPDLEGCRLIFRARLRSSESSGAFLQIRARFPNEPNEVVTPKPPVIVEGNTNWATYEVEMVLPPKRRPDLLRLNLESLGVKDSNKNRVWIKDMELLKAP